MKLALIELNQISKSFEDLSILKNISLNIYDGEIFGIIGLSGAGKSTLLRVLSLITRPDFGSIKFLGEEIDNWQWSSLRFLHKQCGFIFQHYNLLESRTCARNIAYALEIHQVPKEEREKRVKELLDLVGLNGKEHFYPSQLSGGEKQRVAIARALAHNPKVLFSDEATSALDPKTTRSILDLLKKINKERGVSIVLITHEMDVIKQICHRVAVLDHGEIVEMGQVVDLFSKPNHPITQYFLHHSSHEVPNQLYPKEPGKKLIRLSFRGALAKQPIISELILTQKIIVNILLGSIDKIGNETIGSLVVELAGSEQNLHQALLFLEGQGVNYEALDHAD